jgi:cytochrome c556
MSRVDGAVKAGVVALLSAAAISAVFGADMTPEQTIKARQSNLKDLGGAFKTVRDQLKLSTPNIAEIKQAARQIDNLSQDQKHWFPKGSGPEAGVKTAAKPEIWGDPDGFSNALAKSSAEAPKLLTLANANDIDGLKAQVGVVGRACKGCHDSYRVPEEH